MDWSIHYPLMKADAKVEFADVGCGYGGLLSNMYYYMHALTFSFIGPAVS